MTLSRGHRSGALAAVVFFTAAGCLALAYAGRLIGQIFRENDAGTVKYLLFASGPVAVGVLMLTLAILFLRAFLGRPLQSA